MNSHDKSCVHGLPPPSPSRPAPPAGSPGATNLPLVLGEQLGAAKEVLVPGEGDHRLGELPQVELQQRGHRVHICCAADGGTPVRLAPEAPGRPAPWPAPLPPPCRGSLCSHTHVCVCMHTHALWRPAREQMGVKGHLPLAWCLPQVLWGRRDKGTGARGTAVLWPKSEPASLPRLTL